MNLLELVQSVHREGRLPGSPPSTVAGLSGRPADLVRWTIEAYNDIQRAKDGRWKWLRASFTVDTVADDADYAYGECTDVGLGGAITRFRAWELTPDDRPHIYLVSDGEATERELVLADWSLYRYLYQRGTHTADYPTYIAGGPDDKLYLGPKPNGIYRVSGTFWRSNQVLADDDDVPEMPVDYHMTIVYRALLKYAYDIVAQEVLARAQAEGQPIYDALSKNQSHARFSLTTGGPLA